MAHDENADFEVMPSNESCIALKWFTDLAMSAVSEGADPLEAKKCAAEVMRRLFKIDVTQSNFYKDLFSNIGHD